MPPQVPGAESRYVDLDGLRMHYVEAGDPKGAPVILLHGFPEFWYSWRFQITALAEQGYRVIAPDQRGYNLTEKKGPYTGEQLAKDILRLQDALGIERCAIVGHDWGGVVAWAFAAFYPERTNCLVSLNSPHPQAFQDACRRGLKQLRMSWYMFFFQLPWLPERAIRANNYNSLRRLFGSLPQQYVTPQDIDYYVEAMAQPGALHAAINWYRNIPQQLMGFGGRIPPNQITVPTCVIWGEKDDALSTLCCDTLPRYVEQLELHFLPESTHWLQMDDPEAVNAHLLAFLGKEPASKC
ncbi:MAG: alpha/beta fold hydrolase [Candidatus Hydrogenedens sp.]|nr:alpha/beta fold hydrolase [Candidatus Hydrogenedens sp.]